ncbi:MAG TPA: YfhO family protein [Thermoanaerobaculia bacterium]|nr:YfhO family protein [Thermoanaerobaculia bacterium]
MPLLLYLLTAALLLGLAHRFVRTLSRTAAVVLLLIPFAFCGFALLTNRVYAPVDLPYESEPLRALKGEYGVENVSTGMHTDVYTEFIPWRHAVRRSLARGEWGLWNPFAMSGDVLLGSQQTAVYSPFTLIACLMPVALSFTYTAAITFFIAALCAFLLARELGCGEAPSFVAAAGWAFATPITLFLLVTMGQTWAWCPLLLLAVHRLVEAPALRNAGLLTFAFTAILYSGHPESVVLCVMVGMIWGVFRLIRGGLKPALRSIGYAAGAGVVALLLSAIHLLPFVEALRASAEYSLREANFVDARPLITMQDSLIRVATSLFPYLHERQSAELEIGAVGSIILALAAYALVRVRTATTWFLGGLAVFSLLAHAEWKPLVMLLRAIPVVELALTDRLSFAFALCAALLAALGVQTLDRRAWMVMGAVLVLIAAGNWWATHTPLVAHGPLKFGQYKVLAEIAGLLLAIAVVIIKPRAALLVALIVGQRVASDGGLYHSFTRRQAYPPVPLLAKIEGGRMVATGNLLIPQTASMYGLEDIRGVPSLTLRAYAETYALWCTPQPVWFQRVDDLTRPFLSFLHVRYALSDRPAPPGWREVARDRGTYLHENTRVLPRAFVPRSVSVGYPRLWNLSDLLKETDFAARAWIETRAPQQTVEATGRVTTREARLGYLLDADMDAAGWIVTSIPNWPGWRATLDGKPVDTAIANHAFVGVPVPRGRHRVRLEYWPRTFAWGAGITIGTLALLACVMLFGPRYAQR